MNRMICEHCKDTCDIFVSGDTVVILHLDDNVRQPSYEYTCRCDLFNYYFKSEKTDWCVKHWSEQMQKCGREMFEYCNRKNGDLCYRNGYSSRKKEFWNLSRVFFWKRDEDKLWKTIENANIEESRARAGAWSVWFDCPYEMEHMLSDLNREGK